MKHPSQANHNCTKYAVTNFVYLFAVQQMADEHSENKKVILRERKRHTARRVASARYADLSWGGYPISGPGGYPILCPVGVPRSREVPHPRSGGVSHPMSGGVPHPMSGGYPIPCPGGTPSQVWGVPHPMSRGTQSHVWGVPNPRSRGTPPHHLDLAGVPPTPGWGTPPPQT